MANYDTDRMPESSTGRPEDRKKTRILFVCLGNICRSPAAEGIMNHLAGQRGLADRIETDSAGIGAWHVGELPDRRMRSHGADHGYDFSSRARQIRHDDMERFDRIVVMDDENYRDVTAMARTDKERGKVVMMTDFCRRHKGYRAVPDPYYGGDKGFELVIELLEDACEGLLERIMRGTDKDGF